MGMTIKKIIKKACIVTIELYSWSFPNIDPGLESSIRIISEQAPPAIPPEMPKKMYINPILLWFVVDIQPLFLSLLSQKK